MLISLFGVAAQPTPAVSTTATWHSGNWVLLVAAVVVFMAIIVAILARANAATGVRRKRKA